MGCQEKKMSDPFNFLAVRILSFHIIDLVKESLQFFAQKADYSVFMALLVLRRCLPIP